jgi:sugar O-acyltransferase (sialic acid O-acetyltransferase NeuD family)
MEDILVIGAGGHGRSCIDLLETTGSYRIKGIIDRKGGDFQSVLGYPVLGSDEEMPRLLIDCPKVLLAIGQIKSADLRMGLYQSLKDQGAILPKIISPLAHVSKHATVSEGTVIMHGSIINASAEIGANCIINSRALIEHDAVVGSHCHISTGAIMNGGTFVGAKTFVGSGAILHEGVRVGEGCIVSAGSVVRDDVEPQTLFKA